MLLAGQSVPHASMEATGFSAEPYLHFAQSVVEAAHLCPLSGYEGCKWRCTCSWAANALTQQGNGRWLDIAPCMPAGIATLGSARKAIKASVAAHSSHAETDNNPKDKGAAD